MSPDDSDFNPYRAPTASTPPKGARPAGFRWRMIPAVFLWIFGVCFLVVGAGNLAAYVGYRIDDPSGKFGSISIVNFLTGLTTGGFWYAGSFFCWRRRWWGEILCVASGFAAVSILLFFNPAP